MTNVMFTPAAATRFGGVFDIVIDRLVSSFVSCMN